MARSLGPAWRCRCDLGGGLGLGLWWWWLLLSVVFLRRFAAVGEPPLLRDVGFAQEIHFGRAQGQLGCQGFGQGLTGGRGWMRG